MTRAATATDASGRGATDASGRGATDASARGATDASGRGATDASARGATDASARGATLAVRHDRIGDLVLSLPALASLAALGPLHAAVSLDNAEVLVGAPFVDGVHVLPASDGAATRAFARLVRRLRPRRVVLLRSRFPLGWVAAMLGVPERVGPFENVDGLAYTGRIRQRRSRCTASEADLGLEVARLAGAPATADPVPWGLPDAHRRRARAWLRGAVPPGRRVVAVHPGSGGSSRNLSASGYRAVIEALLAEPGLSPLVTAAPSERTRALELVAGLPVPVHVGVAGPLAHAGLLAEVDVLVSGSTGSMHLAALVGTPTVSLFSPVGAASPVRWAPWRAPAAVTLVPPVPACERCVGSACPFWDCMDRIGVVPVLEAVRAVVRSEPGGAAP